MGGYSGYTGNNSYNSMYNSGYGGMNMDPNL